MMFLSIGQAAQMIGVSIPTLRRWEKSRYFKPDYRTCGNHRRYSVAHIEAFFFNIKPAKNNDLTIAYARVSSHAQKLDLKRQEKRLAKYCKKQAWEYQVIADLGSGINYKKTGLNKLLKLICNKSITRVVLTHRDRLLRFGSQLIFNLCKYFNIEVIILDDVQTQSFESALVADVLEIMTVFTAKLYGKRAHSNRKACA